MSATTRDSEDKLKSPNTPPTHSQFSVSTQPPLQLNYASPPPVSVPTSQLSLSVDDHERRRRNVRESRIILPDEAARYIQAQQQQESPIPSPRPRLAELLRAQEHPDSIEGSLGPAMAIQQESTRPTSSSCTQSTDEGSLGSDWKSSQICGVF